MPPSTRSTSTVSRPRPGWMRRRGERGQAIVFVALMIVVLIGFIGLAIDGGRLYWERRILQNSVDAAALVTLSTQKCTGGSSPSTSTGGSNSEIDVVGGNIQANGSVTNAGTISVSGGSFSDNCTNPVPSGITATGGLFAGVAPVVDPGFSSGTVSYYPNAQSAGSNLTLQPGTYAADPSAAGSQCYFLSPGIYQLNAGMN